MLRFSSGSKGLTGLSTSRQSWELDQVNDALGSSHAQKSNSATLRLTCSNCGCTKQQPQFDSRDLATRYQILSTPVHEAVIKDNIVRDAAIITSFVFLFNGSIL